MGPDPRPLSAPAWKTAWITGASSGLGRELAVLLDREVGHVAISARSADRLEAVAGACAGVTAYPLDVTDAAAVAECVNAIEAAAGPIDLAVLNAGTWSMMEVDELHVATIRKAMNVNYFGVVHALDALLPRMIARGAGHIAIVGSVAGYRGLPRAIAYGPTKAALISLAETLHSELAPRGIAVSIVNPGFIDTAMTRGNPFPMPGLMSADAAARKLLAGLRQRQYEIVFPRGLVFGMKLLKLLPHALFFWLIRRAVWRQPG